MDKKSKERSATYALIPLLTLTKAKNELSKGALALVKDQDPTTTMKHVFAAKGILAVLDHNLELLARECEFVAHGESKAFDRIQRSRYVWETFMNLWKKRLFPPTPRPYTPLD